MKYNISLGFLLGAIASLGLVSCQANSPTPTEVQAQQKIKSTGSATASVPLQVLADAYQDQSNKIRITFLPPSQTAGGIAGVKGGLVDFGTVTRPPKPEEDNGTLIHREIARDALLVATHPGVAGVTNLSTEQLQAIYSGQVTNWQELGGPDATIVVLDRPEDESAKKLLRQHYLGQDLKNTPSAVIMRHESDLIAAVQSTPYSIGAFSLAHTIANQLPVNRLSLNHIEPTAENVEAQEYLMVRHLGIVFSKTPSAATQNFVDFAFSPTGKEILSQSGFIPSD